MIYKSHFTPFPYESTKHFDYKTNPIESITIISLTKIPRYC